jgi:hypothetical protein
MKRRSSKSIAILPDAASKRHGPVRATAIARDTSVTVRVKQQKDEDEPKFVVKFSASVSFDGRDVGEACGALITRKFRFNSPRPANFLSVCEASYLDRMENFGPTFCDMEGDIRPKSLRKAMGLDPDMGGGEKDRKNFCLWNLSSLIRRYPLLIG